ncbi:MAG: hypothetical protein FWH04_06880, partial [Oscillospiraceae bacterium]|nr:hypothetical protein [Oscillospiraceae bacterium]
EVPLSLHRQIAGAAFLSLSYAHYIDRRILCQPTVVTKLNRRGIVGDGLYNPSCMLYNAVHQA